MVLLALLQTIGATKYVYSQVHMGVNFTLTLYAPSETVAQSAAQKAFFRIQKLDEIMSDYQAKSELNSLNQTAFHQDVVISQDLFKVLNTAQDLSRRTDGLFDVTVRPLVQIWRTARKSVVAPSQASITEAKKLVDYRQIKLNSRHRTIRFLRDGITIDLGGIGKGYACQEAVKVLQREGVESAMIEGGGDIYCSKAPPKAKGWVISIEGTTQQYTISNRALSTSGSTVQFVEIGGKKYSHIVDPRTGFGVTSQRQVTVIGKDGAKVDALATAFCIEPTLIGRFRDVKATVTERN